jgi:uncharacterized protein
MSGFRIDVADLLAHPGTRREVALSEVLDGLAGSAASVDGPVEATVRLERIPEGIVVRGTLRCRWVGECSYCLREVARGLDLHVDELFETEPVDGETYPIEGHQIDLEQLIRDAVLLELPLAPHCDAPCAPETDADDGDEAAGAAGDPRWAALADLEIRERSTSPGA